MTRRTALAASAATATASILSRPRSAGAQEATPVASPAATPTATVNPIAASVPHVFDSTDFQFSFYEQLGAVYEQAADAGELFAAAAQIKDGDYDSWYDTFSALGDRIRAIGDSSAAAGQSVSAREAYLRASNYYGAALFYVLGTADPGRLDAIFEAQRSSFDAFAALLTPAAEQIEIPYEDTTLPGYAFRVDDSGEIRPWLVLNNGSDGTVTFLWGAGIAAGLRRGYNVLIFDGPGQGAALFRQQLYFRPDWEKVITPVVDWLLTQPDVDPDRLALMGMSQGGYWVPRALAFEHRFAAAIADPGVMDVATSWTQTLPPGVFDEFVNAPAAEQQQIAAEIDQGVAEATAQDPSFRFTLALRTMPFGTKTYAETLLALAQYNLRDVVGQIKTPLLIASPEGETFWPGQSEELYAALTGPKELVDFTAAEGADLHCEPKALGLRGQRFFDWLAPYVNPA